MAESLVVKKLSGGYTRGVDIIHDISLTAQPREIVVIAGTNGAGKSTLLRGVVGLLPRSSGDIVLNGRSVITFGTEDRIKSGMGYVPQVSNIFGLLTVKENLLLGNFRKKANMIGQMLSLFPELRSKLTQKAGTLSGGERQRLAFARALAGEPKVLVLDEPTAALAPAIVEDVFQLIRKLRDTGLAILLVEQRARQALAIADHGYIMDRGSIVLSGAASELLADRRMVDLYLGTAAHT